MTDCLKEAIRLLSLPYDEEDTGPSAEQIRATRAGTFALIALTQRLDAQAADAYLDTRVANIERGTLRIYRRLAILEESGRKSEEAE